jgi:hypothetical protein
LPARSRAASSFAIIALLSLFLALSPRLAQPAHAAAPNTDAAQRAIAWLRGQQLDDGSFAAGSPGFSADVALAFESAGINPATVQAASGTDLLTYLESAPGILDTPGVAGKVVLVLTEANEIPETSDGQSLVDAINQGYDSSTGLYGSSFYGHLYAVLGLLARGLPVEQGAMTAIFNAQQPDGSWNFNGDPTPGTGDSNTTAVAIQALAASGAGRDAAQRGLSYIESLQDSTGAVAYDAYSLATGGDANSTAVTIQAFVAMGGDPSSAAGGDLMTALAAFQNPSGAFQFQPAYPDDSPLATAQATPALELKALPLSPVPVSNPLADAVLPAAPQAGCDYHDATQHNLCGVFRDFWTANGGLANFGYALSESFDEFGMTVQYFERARFELHPENAGTPYEVLLTRVGADEVAREHQDRTTPAAAQDGCQFFVETGHNLCGNLAQAWNDFGGLAVFGFPLTEPFEENGMTVQYFERARFETAPGVWPQRDDMLLGRLGAELVDRELAR